MNERVPAAPSQMLRSKSTEVASTNVLLARCAARPTGARAFEMLRSEGVRVTSDMHALSPTSKLSLLQHVDESFYPTKLEQTLYCDFHDAIRAVWEHADPASPTAIRRYRAFADAIQSASPVLMPTAKFPGKGYVLCCATGSAGTRFVERSVIALGAHLDYARSPEGDEIPYWPAMVVQWPSCGTAEQFQANFLSVIDGNLERGRFLKTVFRNSASKKLRSIYVSALASIVNVGIVFVTGASSANFGPERSQKVLAFIDEFMRTTGISVVFACTPPVYEMLVCMGPICASMTSGGLEEIQWLDTRSQFYAEVNLHLYNQSLVWSPLKKVPPVVLDRAASCTHGSRDALNVFYRLLHTAAIRQGNGVELERLLDGVVKTMTKQTDQLQRVAAFLRSFLDKKCDSKARLPDGHTWADFLSLDVYRELRV